MTTTNPLNARFAPMDAHFDDCEAGRRAMDEYIGARANGADHAAACLQASNVLQRAGYNVNARGGVSIDTDEQIVDQYTVQADPATGEWLGLPAYEGEVRLPEWHKMQDDASHHYDTYTAEIHDETGYCVGDELRAIKVIWAA